MRTFTSVPAGNETFRIAGAGSGGGGGGGSSVDIVTWRGGGSCVGAAAGTCAAGSDVTRVGEFWTFAGFAAGFRAVLSTVFAVFATRGSSRDGAGVGAGAATAGSGELGAAATFSAATGLSDGPEQAANIPSEINKM